MSNEVSVWNKVMSAAMSMPGVKVDRESFLSKELKPYCTDDKINVAISEQPIKVVNKDIIDRIAKSCINNHTTKVTCLSAAAGMPGGIVMAATIPADMAQYYWHVFVLSQKLAYLYGFPDLCDENGNLTESAQDMLTLFVGIMMGASAANQGVKYVSEQLAKQVVKRLPQMTLTKTFYYPIIKQVAKWIGVKLTKDTFAKAAGKAIPILGGVISGALTLATFKPGAGRLRSKLEEQMYLISNSQANYEQKEKSEDKEYTEYEEDQPENNVDLGKLTLLALINMAKIDFNLAPEEIDYITQLIDESELDDDDKMELVAELHKKDFTKIDFNLFKGDMQHTIALMSKLAQVAKADNVVKPEEKIYLNKIGKDLGFSKEEIADMLN
jgi:tellurite resistance protein